MPTVVTRTIGATSSPTTPDYTSLQSWEDAIPANLVTADEQHIGECLDQGTFTSGITIGGHTVDATRNIILRCASGASFSDKAGVRTTALRYNTANGVTIQTSGTAIANSVAYVRFEGLQVKRTAYGGAEGFTISNVLGCVVESCIVDHGLSIGAGAGNTKVRNCLIMGSGSGQISEYYGCTLIGAGSGAAFAAAYGNSPKSVNCAVFNFASYAAGTPASGSNYNASDLASGVPGANSLSSLTYADQFESTSNDWRAKSGADLIGAGVQDLTNYPEDISGFTRANPPTIGAWEFDAGGGGGVSVEVPVAALTLTTFAPTVLTPQTITVPKVDLTTTGFAPTVSTPVTVTVPKIDLTTSLFAPTVSTPQTITVPKVDLATTGFAPTVTISGNQVVTPGVATLTLTTFAPVIGYDQTIDVPAASLTLTGLAPTVLTPILVTPGAVNLTTSLFAPTVTADQNIVVTPGVLALILTTYAPTVTGSVPILNSADFQYTAPHMLLDFTPYEGLLDYTSIAFSSRIIPRPSN